MSENLPAVQATPSFAVTPYTGGNAGAVEIESQRAIAEAQGQLVLAKRFPRTMTACTADFMDSCRNPAFAEVAFYAVPNRGSGPSIRFAEEAARCYGNFEYGHREIGRIGDTSEIEVYAWDKEKNNRSVRQITVKHVTDTKNGPKKLTDQADIDNKIANVASKQMRGRILALMPKHMIASGIAECKLTLSGGNEKPLQDRIVKMLSEFSKIGVTPAVIEAHLSHSADNMTTDEFADLRGIFAAIREGAKASEYFNISGTGEKPDAGKGTAAAIIAGTTAPKEKPIKKEQAKAETAETKAKEKLNDSAEIGTISNAVKTNSNSEKTNSNPTKETATQSIDASIEDSVNAEAEAEQDFGNDVAQQSDSSGYF